jgi:nitrite reductase (NADH) small subunit
VRAASSLDSVTNEETHEQQAVQGDDAADPGPQVHEAPHDQGPAEDGDAAGWVRVCALDRLTPNRGVAALVDGQQVAVFRLPGDEVRAIGNLDPFSHAHVLSRGVVGDAGGIPKVASPVYKQSFDLRTGQCLDEPDVAVPTYPVRVDDDGSVLVAVPEDGSP